MNRYQNLLIELIAVGALTAPALGIVPRAQQEQQGQKIKVGPIEFFGIGDSRRQKAVGGRKAEGKRQKAKDGRKYTRKYTRERLEQLRRALPVKEGDRLSFEAVDAARDAIKRAITRADGQPPTDVSPVCCDDHGDLVFFIGLPGPAFRKLHYNSTPRGPKVRLQPPANPDSVGSGTDKSSYPTLPADIIGLSGQVDELMGEAVRIEPGEDRSQGYALSLYPPLRAVQIRIREFAVGHEPLLRLVLSTAADAKQRRAAAHVLGYAAENNRQINALARAARDSDGGVRNEATRALGVLAQASATAAARIPPEGFVFMLSSGKWLDRNKSAFLLSILTAKRDPVLLSLLRRRALESLIEMARWRDTTHAQNARVILGRVAGIEEQRLQKLASEGAVEEIIRLVH